MTTSHQDPLHGYSTACRDLHPHGDCPSSLATPAQPLPLDAAFYHMHTITQRRHRSMHFVNPIAKVISLTTTKSRLLTSPVLSMLLMVTDCSAIQSDWWPTTQSWSDAAFQACESRLFHFPCSSQELPQSPLCVAWPAEHASRSRLVRELCAAISTSLAMHQSGPIETHSPVVPVNPKSLF